MNGCVINAAITASMFVLMRIRVATFVSAIALTFSWRVRTLSIIVVRPWISMESFPLWRCCREMKKDSEESGRKPGCRPGTLTFDYHESILMQTIAPVHGLYPE
jgi:hypothetical protein